MGSDYISLLSTITDYSKCNDKRQFTIYAGLILPLAS